MLYFYEANTPPHGSDIPWAGREEEGDHFLTPWLKLLLARILLISGMTKVVVSVEIENLYKLLSQKYKIY